MDNRNWPPGQLFGTYVWDLTDLDGALYFLAQGGAAGSGLWRSNGTEAGTVLVKAIRPDANSHNVRGLVNVHGTLFFTASNGTEWSLWKSDGTEQGTKLLKTLKAIGTGGPTWPGALTSVGDTLYFVAHDGIHGWEVWKSNGTADGTVLLKDISPEGNPDDPNPLDVRSLAAVDSTLYFAAGTDSDGFDLWKSDGTEAGTVRVKATGGSNPYTVPDRITGVAGTAFFRTGPVLWKSDGTEAGTFRVKHIGSVSYPLEDLTAVDGTLFFSAGDHIHGRQLWKSDGTEAGTVMVKDIPEVGSGARNLINVDGSVFFTIDDGGYPSKGTSLWKSDGTDAGTVMVGFGGEPIANVSGTLFFQFDDGVHGAELWRYGEPVDNPPLPPPSDTSGPSVLSVTPTGVWAGSVDHFDITFSEPIDPATLTVEDVRVVDSSAAPLHLGDPVALDATRSSFRVNFAKQSSVGTYQIEVGPDITDAAGNRMDPDNDGRPGESGDDVHRSTVELVRTPVVVVPGITGSLFEDMTRKINLGARFITFLRIKQPYHPFELAAERVEGTYDDLLAQFVNLGYRLFDPDNQRLPADTVWMGKESDLFFAAYDWRQPILLNPQRPGERLWDTNPSTFQSGVEYLDWWIQLAKVKWIERYGSASGFAVDIVAHSMGGLVARAYLQEGPASLIARVNNLVMLGTPNHGSVSIYGYWDANRPAVAFGVGTLRGTEVFLRTALAAVMTARRVPASEIVKSLPDLMPTFPFFVRNVVLKPRLLRANHLLLLLNSSSSLGNIRGGTNIVVVGSTGTPTPTHAVVPLLRAFYFRKRPIGDGRVVLDRIPGIDVPAGTHVSEDRRFKLVVLGSKVAHGSQPGHWETWSVVTATLSL